MLLEGKLHILASTESCVMPADCPWSWEGSREEVWARVNARARLEVHVGALNMQECQGAVWIPYRQAGPFLKHPQVMKGNLFARGWNGLSRQNRNV